MEVTPSDRITDKLLQPKKVVGEMDVTFPEKVTYVRPVQYSKAAERMDLTLAGIVMEDKLVHLEKALKPI